ncbi:MAG: ATP phosphoribosyltransferase regulatory subunit [Solobacterium sp.]|nr:ATP phosphoribosyltransferase regulatory subunit [Solobacterium sp.]
MTLEEKLNRLFEGFGYRKFRMSKFEEYDLYASNKDFLTSSQLITFTDLDGSLLALKPDITLSIIKSTNEARKVYYNENVYRAKDHHYREIPQAGVECIGTIDSYAEAEVIALAAKSLQAVEKDYILRISDVGFVRSFLEAEGVKSSYREFIIDAMEEKNAGYIRSLRETGILKEETASVLEELINLYLPLSKGVRKVRELVSDDTLTGMLDHLQELAGILSGFEVTDNIYLDFSLVNSMDYYNGVIFQGAVSGIPFTVLSGGRYDRLPEKMGKQFGAIGFAVYMDVVENRRKNAKSHDGDILVIYDEKDRPAAISKTVNALMNQGYKVRAVNRLDDTDRTRWKRVMSVKAAKKEAGL